MSKIKFGKYDEVYEILRIKEGENKCTSPLREEKSNLGIKTILCIKNEDNKVLTKSMEVIYKWKNI